MTRALKVIAWIAGALVVLGVLLVIAVAWLVNSDWFLQQAQRRSSDSLGRETRIDGLSIDWGWTTLVRLEGISVANSEWGESNAMFAADEAMVALRIPPLLRGEVAIADLRLTRPELAVEINAQGESNWSFGENPAAATAAEAAAPDERAEVPSIANLDIVDGILLYRDATRGLRLDGTLGSASGEAGGARRIQLEADGTLEDRPLTVRFTGGSVLLLRDENRPYPLDVYLSFGETVLTAKGQVVDPLHFGAGAIDLNLSGPNWADIFPILGIPAPPTPPYRLSMALSRDGNVWQASGIDGRIGESDISGEVLVDYSRQKPFLKADLTSRKLDFDDLGPLVGAPPAVQGEAASAAQKQTAEELADSDDLFPDRKMNARLLHVMDMDVSFSAESVQREGLPIQSLSARILVRDGRAEAKPLKIATADGVVEGEMALNARSQIPSADARLTFRDLNLQEFFRDSEFFQQMGGRFSGRISLLGVGSSLAEVMATSNGEAAIVMREGSISGLLVEGAALDIGEALVLFITEDARVPIRCAGGRFRLDEGQMSTERLIMDTTDSVVYVKGWVDLAAQTLELELDAQAKDFSLLDLKSTVEVSGKLGDPSLSLGSGAPIPFIEIGDGEDVDCDWLVNQTLAE